MYFDRHAPGQSHANAHAKSNYASPAPYIGGNINSQLAASSPQGYTILPPRQGQQHTQHGVNDVVLRPLDPSRIGVLSAVDRGSHRTDCHVVSPVYVQNMSEVNVGEIPAFQFKATSRLPMANHLQVQSQNSIESVRACPIKVALGEVPGLAVAAVQAGEGQSLSHPEHKMSDALRFVDPSRHHDLQANRETLTSPAHVAKECALYEPPDTTRHEEEIPRSESSGRLRVSSKGRQELTELMQSKDKLREFAARPFRRDGKELTFLCYDDFCSSLKNILREIEMSMPADDQIRRLFSKHKRENEGVGREEFESLLFRLLSFMLASGEVDTVSPGRSAKGEERDKNWRQEFLQQNRKRFGDVYEFGQALGEGSFGSVHLCKHLTERLGANRRVRVVKKILKSRAAKMGTSREKVRDEFAVLKRLDHPHVVRIFEDFEDDESFYLVMEQCKGGDIQDAVRNPGTSDAREWEKWVAQVIYQILSAISYCHGRGVIHKDLKPENVMMSSEGGISQDTHIVVVDFGLSEMFSNSTDRKQEVAGTPPFMAPEVWKGKHTEKCDIWSCGVILFYMLSGTFPFIADRLEDFPKLVSMDPQWHYIGGASEDVQITCRRMLCRQEAGRPGAQELLRDKWFSVWGLGVESVRLFDKHLYGLMEVKQRSHFEKFVSRLVATQLDSGKQKLINQAFRAFDIDKDGVLSFEEIVQGLQSLGVRVDEARQVADELDVGRSGHISYTEFLAGVMDLRRRSPTERDKFLWLAWQQFSPDDAHMVKINAIQDALASRGLTVAELPREFLRLLQRGTSQQMSFEDFRSLFQADEESYMQSSIMQSCMFTSMRSKGEVV